jgi:hypothetical protein
LMGQAVGAFWARANPGQSQTIPANRTTHRVIAKFLSFLPLISNSHDGLAQ